MSLFQLDVNKKTVVDKLLIALLFSSFLLARASFFDENVTNDSRVYIRIAENLVLHQCYSLAEPTSGECIPTWGNQPPGYPIFIAATFFTSGNDLRNIVLAQSVVYAIFACYALWVAYLWLNRSRPILFCGFLMVLSPLTIVWPSWILTESLAGATTLWVFVELIQSVRKGAIRLFPVSLALIVAVMFRWDQIWLVVPVVLFVFYLHGTKIAIRKSTFIGLLVALPYVMLVARAVWLGLPMVPQHMESNSDPWLPNGVVAFYKVTSINQNAASGLLWPIWSRHYENLSKYVDYDAFIKDVRGNKFRSLVETVEQIPNNTPFPTELEREFFGLALDYKQNNTFFVYFMIPIIRTINMWTGLDERTFSGWAGNKLQKPIESFSRTYKITLIFLTIIMLFILLRKNNLLFLFALSFLLFIVLRTAFLVSIPITAIEIRYLMPFFPTMEIFLLMSICFIYKRFRDLQRLPIIGNN